MTIVLYVEDKPRQPTDILFGVQPVETPQYRVELLDPHKDEVKDLGNANTFFLIDDTDLQATTAALVANQKNSFIYLTNKPAVTMEETLAFYEKISITTGAIVTVGPDTLKSVLDFQQRTKHVTCTIENVDFVAYPGRDHALYTTDDSFTIYVDGKLGAFFKNYCQRFFRAQEEESHDVEDDVYTPPFMFTNSLVEADLFLSFDALPREYLRMIDSRMRNVYVPYSIKHSFLDPRSFFKANSDYLNEMASTTTEHQAAAILRTLHDDMFSHIIEVFKGIQDPSVKIMKAGGSIDLFQAIAFNFSRTV